MAITALAVAALLITGDTVATSVARTAPAGASRSAAAARAALRIQIGSVVRNLLVSADGDIRLG